VGRGVRPQLALVAGRPNHLALANHHGADRHVLVLGGALCLFQGEAHELLVAPEESILGHALSM
jgi:hypothetical protein